MDVPHAKRSKVASNRHSRDDELAEDWFVPAHRLVMPWCSQPIATMGASLSYFLARLTAVNRKAAQPYFVMGSHYCVTRDVLLVGRAEPDCLEGGTHEETLHPQVNPKVEGQRFRGTEVLSRLPKDPRIR